MRSAGSNRLRELHHFPPLSAELAYYFRSKLHIKLASGLATILRASSGPEGTRTPYLYSAIVALSQLSYSPENKSSLFGRGLFVKFLRPEGKNRHLLAAVDTARGAC